MDKVRTTKKLIVLAILGAILFFAASTVFAHAQINIKNYENYEGITSYHYFDSPESITADETNFYITDEGKISVFSLSDNSQKKDITPQNQSVIDIAAYNEIVYTIEIDGVYEYSRNTSNQIITRNELEHIFVTKENIYLSDSDNVYVYSKESLSLLHTLSSPVKIKYFTVINDIVYAVTEGLNRYRNSVYALKSGQASVCALENINTVYGIIALDNKITLLFSNKISTYSLRINELFEDSYIEAFDITAICSANNTILALTGERSVQKLDTDLSKFTEILASSSDAKGFYKNPVDITTRFGKTYITDRGNNRIAVHDGKTHSYLSLIRPSAASVDNSGTVYVAHNENKIAAFNKNGERENTDEIIKAKNNLTDTNWFSELSISDIELDSFDNMFMLTRDGKLYIKKSTEEFFILYAADFLSIAHSPGNTEVFGIYSATNKVIKLYFDADDNIQSQSISISTIDAIDIAVDTDNSIYLLKSSNHLERYNYSIVYKSTPDISETVNSSGLISKIEVSAIDNDTVKYRDVVCIDTKLSTLKVIPHENLNISYEDLNQQETLPSSFKTELNNSVKLVHTVTKKGGAEIYAQSSETSVIKVLPEGYRVFVLDYKPKSKFTKIICDTINIGSNSANAPITVGYISTANLSEALPYSNEHENTCHVWLHPIAIYALPSRQAPVIEGFESVQKNTPLILLDFVTHSDDNKSVYGYKDNFPKTDTINQNNIWYRVKVEKDGKYYEGFVFAVSVSVLGGNPDLSIRPQTNAVIIAKSKDYPNLGAYVYYYDEQTGTYEIDIKYGLLSVGIKVEVVGKFDSSEPYTKILFYSEYGTVEAYVETANLKYQGVNFAQIIAIILVIITVILIVILLLRKSKKQREKMH